MAKDNRLFGKFGLDFPDHPKILPLSDAAFRCLVEATLWSRKQMTDGLLARRYAVAKWGVDVLAELSTNDPENPSLIESEEGWMLHDFAEHQDTRAEIEARSARNKAAGRRGGLAKAKQSAKQGAKRPASGTLSESLPETETETETEEQKQKTSSPAAPSMPKYPAPFEAFWAVYPRKTGKGQALTAWEKARRKIGDQPLIAAAGIFASDPNLPETEFIPHAATWLNGCRWDDGPLPARGTTTRHPDEYRTGWDELLTEPNRQIGA